MKSRSWIILLLLLVSVGGLFMWSYAATPPTEEMTQAEDAILSAEIAVADVYATEDFKAATDALADAESKLKNNAYPAAKAAAIDAQAKAIIAKANAEAIQQVQKMDAAQQGAALQAAELKLSALKDDQVAVKIAAMKLSAKLQEKKADELNREVMDLEAALATAQGQIDQRNAADVRQTLAELNAAAARQKDLKYRLGLAISPAADHADDSRILTAGMVTMPGMVTKAGRGTITGTAKFTKEKEAPRITQLMKGVMVSPNDGIKDVSVSLLAQNGHIATATDAEGSFSLFNVPPGAYTVQCSHPQLGKQEAEVTVIADRMVKVHFSYFYWSR